MAGIDNGKPKRARRRAFSELSVVEVVPAAEGTPTASLEAGQSTQPRKRSRAKAKEPTTLYCLEMIYSRNKKDIRFRTYTTDEKLKERFLNVPPIPSHKSQIYPQATEVTSSNKKKKLEYLLRPYIEQYVGKLPR